MYAERGHGKMITDCGRKFSDSFIQRDMDLQSFCFFLVTCPQEFWFFFIQEANSDFSIVCGGNVLVIGLVLNTGVRK